MTERNVDNINVRISREQFRAMYLDGYKKSPNDKVYHIDQKTFKGDYVTNKKFVESLIPRWRAYRALHKKEPLAIWTVKAPGSTVVIPVTSKVCNVNTTFRMQPNNWTCGVTVLRMIASRHGLNPSYDWTVSNAWANSNNGTGHSGFRNVLTELGFKSAVSVYRKDGYDWAKIRKLMSEGYDVAVNLMTGGLWDWSGNWAHWVLVQCVDDDYVWIHDPDKGASRRHDIYTMNDCMDHNGNPDFIIAKYR